MHTLVTTNQTKGLLNRLDTESLPLITIINTATNNIDIAGNSIMQYPKIRIDLGTDFSTSTNDSFFNSIFLFHSLVQA